MQRVELPNITLDGVLQRLNKKERHVYALGSVSENGWESVLGWNPVDTYEPTSKNTQITVKELECFTEQQRSQQRLVIGYISYDFGCLLQGVKLKNKDVFQTPPILAASFSSWISFHKNKAIIHAADPAYVNKVTEIIKRPAQATPTKLYKKSFTPKQSRESYNTAYQTIKDYIAAGDIYQVNYTHQLEGSSSLSGRELFGIFHKSSKANFQAFIEHENFEILSFSPERFIKIQGQEIRTSPIKGTRPRGKSAEEDQALKNDLRTNPKDNAELNMITDLLRNDIGKISKIGSVKVTEQRTLTSYPTLWHAHSTIVGTLHEDITPIAALASLMPGGSITGCPKKRAIEIIDETEMTARGIYTGSIFCATPDGNLDSNIAIRTIIKKSEQLYLSVGGGIVYDSMEAEEYKESIDKAASFIHTDSSSILSSDILEQQFGPTAIDIIYQDSDTRIICTKTINEKKILELSMVEFIKDGVAAFPTVHKAIQAGKSMGKAFRDHSITFTRELKSVQTYALPQKFHQYFSSNKAATVVHVTILVGVEKIPYANILEIYHGDVIWGEGTPMQSGTLDAKLRLLSKFL